MSDSELIYELEADPPPAEKFFAALQHVLASFVGVITPTLIIGGALGLGEQIPYLISMALMVSGVGTIIQAKKPMNVGAGMICVQGTSFAFLSSVLAAGFLAKAQGGGRRGNSCNDYGCLLLRGIYRNRLEPVFTATKKTHHTNRDWNSNNNHWNQSY